MESWYLWSTSNKTHICVKYSKSIIRFQKSDWFNLKIWQHLWKKKLNKSHFKVCLYFMLMSHFIQHRICIINFVEHFYLINYKSLNLNILDLEQNLYCNTHLQLMNFIPFDWIFLCLLVKLFLVLNFLITLFVILDLVSSHQENVTQTHNKMQKSSSPVPPSDNEALSTVCEFFIMQTY